MPRRIATAARAAPASPAAPRPVDLLLDGLALLITEGPAAGTPTLRKALSAFGRATSSRPRKSPLAVAGRPGCGIHLGLRGWDSLTTHHIRAAREAGALAQLPLALSHSRRGPHSSPERCGRRRHWSRNRTQLAEATDGRVVPAYGALALAAFRGDEDELTRLSRPARQDFIARGEGIGLTVSHWVTAALYNGLGRYDDAFAAAEQGHRRMDMSCGSRPSRRSS